MTSTNAMEKMVINYETTYLTDYRWNEFKDPIFTENQERPMERPKKPKDTNFPPLNDVQTMSVPKRPVPFTLYHKPKGIVREDPRIIQKKYEKQVNEDLDEVIATRPRVVISPAVSPDDIKEKHTRNLVINDTYMSTVMKANSDILNEYFSINSPFLGIPASARPILTHKKPFPEVPEEWRKETVTWDSKQLRAFTSPTERFWQNQKLPPCKACEATAIVAADRAQKLKNK